MCCCFIIIFFLFVHAVIHSSACLVTDQTKLSLKSQQNMCKCSWRLCLCPFHFCFSLTTSQFLQCLRHCGVGGNQQLALWCAELGPDLSEEPRLNALAAAPFLSRWSVQGQVVHAAFGSVYQACSACPFVRMWVFYTWTPPEIKPRFFKAPDSSQMLPKLCNINIFAGPELSQALAFASQLLASTASTADGGVWNVQWAL